MSLSAKLFLWLCTSLLTAMVTFQHSSASVIKSSNLNDLELGLDSDEPVDAKQKFVHGTDLSRVLKETRDPESIESSEIQNPAARSKRSSDIGTEIKDGFEQGGKYLLNETRSGIQKAFHQLGDLLG